MAALNADPMDDLVARARVQFKPISYYTEPVIHDFDFEVANTNLCTRLREVFVFHDPLRDRYHGSEANITTAMNTDVDSMVQASLLVLYNRLRSILDTHSPATRTARMNPRAVISNRLVFPRFLAAALSAIGPLRVEDGPQDMLILYASTANTMAHYGRAAAHAFVEGHYSRIINYMRACNIALAPIDFNTPAGRFYTTISAFVNESRYDFIGAYHSNHYENDDLVRAMMMMSATGTFPWKDSYMTVSSFRNAEMATALGQARPPNVATAVTAANAVAMPRGGTFWPNIFGVIPAIPAIADIAEQPAGAWILGRGVVPIYSVSLATDIGPTVIIGLMRHRLTAS